MTEVSGAWGTRGQLATDGFQPRDSWNPPDPSGRGAAPFSVPYGATNAPKNIGLTGDQYVQVLKQFFGEPAKPYGPAGHILENYDLPDAYVGKNTYIRRIIQREIRRDELFPLYDLLPWKENNNSIVIAWEQWKFHDHGLDAEPHEGVPRLITSEKEAFSASLTRYGLAFVMEHGFMRTPDGIENYARNIATIANAVKETCAHMAMVALFSCRPYDDSQSAGDIGSIPDLEKLFQAEIDMWACAQKTQWGVELAIGQLRERMSKRGVSNATYFVAPEGMMKAASFQNARMYNFLSGHIGGPSEPKPEGVSIRESRPFLTGRGRLPEDPCFSNNSIGEFYTMGYHHWAGGSRKRSALANPASPEYYSDLMDTVLYDEDHDQMVRISFEEAIQNCGLFDVEKDWETTALGRHYFSRLEATDGSGRVLGPFNTWADWLIEFDPQNIVTQAISAKAKTVDVTKAKDISAFLSALFQSHADDPAADFKEAKEQVAAEAGRRTAGTAGTTRQHARAYASKKAYDDAVETDASSSALRDAIVTFSRAFVEKSIPTASRDAVNAFGPSFINYIERVRSGFELLVSGLIPTASMTPAVVAAVNKGEMPAALEKAVDESLQKQHSGAGAGGNAGKDSAVIFNSLHAFIGSAFVSLASIEKRWTALAEAESRRQQNPVAFMERARSKVHFTVNTWVHYWGHRWRQDTQVVALSAETGVAGRVDMPLNEATVAAMDLNAFETLYQVLTQYKQNMKTGVSEEHKANVGAFATLYEPQRVLAALDRMPLTDGKFVQFCLENDIPSPISVLLLRPHMTYRMGTGVLLVPNGGTGNTFLGHLDFELADDATRKMHFGHFTMYAKSLVLENRALTWARNMYAGGYLGGAGTTFWLYNDDPNNLRSRTAYLNAALNASLIACPLPIHFKPQNWHLDATGRYNPSLYASRSAREPLHWPGADIFASYWNWRNNSSLAFTQHSPMQNSSVPPTANTVCFQGFQMVVDKSTRELKRPIVNRGHWGPNVCVGAAAVRRGAGAVLPVPSYLGQMPVAQLQV